MEQFTQLNTQSEVEEILLTWLKRDLTSYQSSKMPENPKITDSLLLAW